MYCSALSEVYLILLSCSKQSTVPPYIKASESPHHSPLKGTKSAGHVLENTRQTGIDYIEVAPVKPAALKTRFNYSTVVPMSPDSEVAHDIAKAQKMKATKAAMPPPPPRPYNVHSETNNSSVSAPATPDGVGGNSHPPPLPLPRHSAPAVPARHGINRNAHSDTVLQELGTTQPKTISPVTGTTYPLGAIPIMVPRESSPPPPPVPRREHSATRGSSNGPVTPPRYASLW